MEMRLFVVLYLIRFFFIREFAQVFVVRIHYTVLRRDERKRLCVGNKQTSRSTFFPSVCLNLLWELFAKRLADCVQCVIHMNVILFGFNLQKGLTDLPSADLNFNLNFTDLNNFTFTSQIVAIVWSAK